MKNEKIEQAISEYLKLKELVLMSYPPEYIEDVKIDMAVAFRKGAMWMAEQFQKIDGYLADWCLTSDGKEYCCGIRTKYALEVPEGFYIKKK